jgi:O-antigen/teichoic acid export membrane protein
VFASQRAVRKAPAASESPAIRSANRAAKSGLPDIFWSAAWRASMAIFTLSVSLASARKLGPSDASLITLCISLVGLVSCIDGGLVHAFVSGMDLRNPAQTAADALEVSRRVFTLRVVPALLAAVTVIGFLALHQSPLRTGFAMIGQLTLTGSAVALSPWERVDQMRRNYRSLAVTTFVGLAVPGLIVIGLVAGFIQSSFWLWFGLAVGAPLIPRLLHALRHLVWRSSRSDRPRSTKIHRKVNRSYPAAKEFFVIQLISVIAFSTDVIVAKLLSLDEAAVQLGLVARLFGPASLVVAVLVHDVWPKVSQAATVSIERSVEVGNDSVKRITVTAALLGVVCIPLPLFANSILPDYAELSTPLIIVAALWFVLSSSGNGAGQVLMGLGRQRVNLRRNVIMTVLNLIGSVILGSRFGAVGFLLSSFLAYSSVVYLPTIRAIQL